MDFNTQETTVAAHNHQLTGATELQEDTTPIPPNEKVIHYYEFSTYSHGSIMFIHLWDDNDLSACERILNRPLGSTQIMYGQTGNGFITDDFGNSFCFKKEPYKPTFTTPTLDVSGSNGDEFGGPIIRRRHHQPIANADDILRGL